MAPVTSPAGGPDHRWALAVDARPGSALRGATADAAGVRPLPPGPLDAALRGLADARRVPPLAVVVVHPGTWDADRAARAADEVGAAVGRVVGDDAVEWPWPVPLDALEAAAWRALEFGLLPAAARVAVVDPGTGEAGVVDRDQGSLASVGRPRSEGPSAAADLVALARRVLDAAPPGPPFAGVVLAGADTSGGTELAAVVARVTGRPPLVAGDPATVALLGAASLAWAVASPPTPAAPSPSPAPSFPADQGNLQGGGGLAGSAPAEPAALPAGPGRRRLPRWARWVLPLAVLAVVAGVAGLLVHRDRAEPSPYTFVCPNGEVVAFRYECDRLAPSPSATP